MDGKMTMSEDLPQNSTYLEAISDGTNIRINDASQRMDGLILFTLSVYPNYTDGENVKGYVIIADTEGNIINGQYYDEGQPISLGLLNSTTCYYSDPLTGNVSIWNFDTNETVILPVDSGHDQFFYNPLTNTILTQQKVRWSGYALDGDSIDVMGDDLVEYDLLGNEIWRWEGNNTLPFNETEYIQRNETLDGYADWTHSNAIYWDMDNDFIYINNENLDNFVKVDHATSNTIWVAGRYIGTGPGLTMYNTAGEVVDSLWYHAHGLEMSSPSEFLLYDNDMWNLTRENPTQESVARFLKLVIDDTTRIASTRWSKISPYADIEQGDLVNLPNGNIAGAIDLAPEPLISEISENGEIVWEWDFNITDDIGWGLGPNNLERFFEGPLVANIRYENTLTEGESALINCSIWDVFHRQYSHEISIVAVEGGFTLLEETRDLLPHWQETFVEFEIPNLVAGDHSIAIIFTNNDGSYSTILIILTVNTNIIPYAGLGVVIVSLIVVVIYYIKKK